MRWLRLLLGRAGTQVGSDVYVPRHAHDLAPPGVFDSRMTQAYSDIYEHCKVKQWQYQEDKWHLVKASATAGRAHAALEADGASRTSSTAADCGLHSILHSTVSHPFQKGVSKSYTQCTSMLTNLETAVTPMSHGRPCSAMT
jgi:hypothetical protein